MLVMKEKILNDLNTPNFVGFCIKFTFDSPIDLLNWHSNSNEAVKMPKLICLILSKNLLLQKVYIE